MSLATLFVTRAFKAGEIIFGTLGGWLLAATNRRAGVKVSAPLLSRAITRQ